tara:strand:+ start:99 stop:530 length:432 start_codon:yes stop_codon:yes gene_type:complete
MARPMYENKKHLQNERRIADELEFDWKCVLKKVSYKLSVDFAMCVNNEIKGWVEIKKRTINYNHSHLYMISMHKIKSARELSKETKLPFFLVVEFKDGIYYYLDKGEKHFLKWGGRIVTQRDSQDQEPCYYIDINLFKKLGEK